jgi:hypothetical protein
MKGLYRSIY